MKTTTIKPPKGNAMERLHDAARDIVDGVRKAARSTGQKGTANLPVHIPVLMAGTDMRVVIEAGPSIAAQNASNHAAMQAGTVPAMPYMDAVRRAGDILTREARILARDHTVAGAWGDDPENLTAKEQHDEMLKVAEALMRGRMP